MIAAHGDVLLASGQADRAVQAWQRYLSLSSNTAILDGLAAETGLGATDTVNDVRRKLAALRDSGRAPLSIRGTDGSSQG